LPDDLAGNEDYSAFCACNIQIQVEESVWLTAGQMGSTWRSSPLRSAQCWIGFMDRIILEAALHVRWAR